MRALASKKRQLQSVNGCVGTEEDKTLDASLQRRQKKHRRGTINEQQSTVEEGSILLSSAPQKKLKRESEVVACDLETASGSLNDKGTLSQGSPAGLRKSKKSKRKCNDELQISSGNLDRSSVSSNKKSKRKSKLEELKIGNETLPVKDNVPFDTVDSKKSKRKRKAVDDSRLSAASCKQRKSRRYSGNDSDASSDSEVADQVNCSGRLNFDSSQDDSEENLEEMEGEEESDMGVEKPSKESGLEPSGEKSACEPEEEATPSLAPLSHGKGVAAAKRTVHRQLPEWIVNFHVVENDIQRCSQ